MSRVRLMTAVIVCVLCTATSVRATPSYLIAPSDADNLSFRTAVSGFLGGASVDYFDARAGTPTVIELQAYNGVFTWANESYADNIGFGNNLATYVNANGRVVLGAFTTSTPPAYFLDGAIMGSGYSPVTSPTGANWFTSASYAGDGSAPLWSGVSSYTATYRDDVSLQGAGILDGTFDDGFGTIAGAYRPDLGVIYLGGMETSGGTSGDDARLLANAFQAQVSAVPEPGTLLLLGSGLVGLGGFGRKRLASRHRGKPE